MRTLLYQQIINTSYSHFSTFLISKEGVIISSSIAFVVGFAIGIGFVMKRFLDIKNQIDNKK